MPPPNLIFTGGPVGDDSGTRQNSSRRLNKDVMGSSSHRGSNRRLSSSGRHLNESAHSHRQLSVSGRGSGGRLMLHEPLDGPWQRVKDEWKDPYSWFGMEDCGRLIDVPSSFGGTQTIWKWLIWLWMMATLIYLWSTAGSAWFLGNLDHWALFFSMCYETLSLANAHFTPPQPGMGGSPNLYLKVFWVLFEIAAHLQLLVTFLFWIITYPKTDVAVDYGMFALHGICMLAVWIDGLVLNKIPVRIKHYFFVLTVDMIYCLWTIIHAGAGLDSGSDNPDEGDAIYLPLNWNDETVQAVFLMIAILAFFAPLCFLLQYLLSLYSFPWNWNGKCRKCIDFDMSRSGMGRSARHSPAQVKPTTGNSETSRSSSQQPPPSPRGRRSSTTPESLLGRRGSSLPRATSPSPPKGRRASSATPQRPTSPAPARRASTASPDGIRVSAGPPPKRVSATPTPARRASSATPASGAAAPLPWWKRAELERSKQSGDGKGDAVSPSKKTTKRASTAPRKSTVKKTSPPKTTQPKRKKQPAQGKAKPKKEPSLGPMDIA